MKSLIYRCGWCGNITDSNGHLINGIRRQRIINIIKIYGNRAHNRTIKVHGKCCPNGDEYET